MSWEEVLSEVDAECRRLEIPMLGPQKAALLVKLVQESRPNIVVEVGTAIGYSGLWIAHTLRSLGHGKLLTFEMDSDRATQAGQNFQRAGVFDLITQYCGDARELLKDIREPIDFLFLDGGFENYYPCYTSCRSQIREGATLLADNAGIGATEMADYLAFVRGHYESKTEWFETDLAWNPRDAMEISVFRAT